MAAQPSRRGAASATYGGTGRNGRVHGVSSSGGMAPPRHISHRSSPPGRFADLLRLQRLQKADVGPQSCRPLQSPCENLCWNFVRNGGPFGAFCGRSFVDGGILGSSLLRNVDGRSLDAGRMDRP
eukprot:TRINITY_DN3875_c0_g1_i1.p5 TRINITY_DN3875_c0_g1~~TRINITY_DN3875_c0_g1_i1.p5  ORF type:complete len:125 (+),score=15.90 TRINITY_DN3875_c0_g1_i1:419-793(+)